MLHACLLCSLLAKSDGAGLAVVDSGMVALVVCVGEHFDTVLLVVDLE